MEYGRVEVKVGGGGGGVVWGGGRERGGRVRRVVWYFM